MVHYHAVDVRDAGQVKRIIDEARAAHGPVRAVIHGAGVLEDRLIVDKSPEQFERVFDTKVKGFQALLAAVPEDDLKVIVAFSSVTARIGNKGQADYAMANEALNKLAWVESLRRPGCRVVSVNWGPWECGMVTPSLKREFERQGVTLLPAADGALSLLQEMARDTAAPVEVVIGGTLNPATIETVTEKSKSHLAILFEREIDAESYPILTSHVIDGKPVVPMAMMAEWFGHGALHENPGLVLHGLEDIRILNGIRLSEQTKLIRLLAGKAQSREGGFEVELELRNGVREGKDIIHSGPGLFWPKTWRYRRSSACPRRSQPMTIHGVSPRSTKKSCSTASASTACARCAPAPRPAWWRMCRVHRRRTSGWTPRCATAGCSTRSRSIRPSRWQASGATSSAGASRCPSTSPPTGSSGPRFRPRASRSCSRCGGNGQENARRLHVHRRKQRGGGATGRLRGRHGPVAEPGLQAEWRGLPHAQDGG